MKKLSVLILLLFAIQFTLSAQDYKVTSVEHLQNDMTARKVILTEKVNGGQKCAVLRIATQSILDLQRDFFQFECDMGSVIRERRKDGGEICLWVSPDIKILKIKHSALGNYILNIPEMLKDNVQSLNTYRITIVGTQELPKETLAYGKCQMVFLPSPNDAVLFINGDSIGAGNHTITSLSGSYHWLLKHPLYQTAEGDVELTKGKIDSVYVALKPAYGYINILPSEDTIGSQTLYVFIDGLPKGTVPFKSDKMAPGVHEVILKVGNDVKAISQIRVKEQLVSINQVDELIWNYEKALNLSKHLTEFNQANNSLGSYENTGFSSNKLDSLYHSKRTQYQPITGKVTIDSKPRAWVMVDSVKYGLTPLTIDNLAVGIHQLELAAGNYTTVKREISVAEEEVMSYHLQLKRSCVATITTDMKGDQVFLNEVFVGKTPVTIERPFGTYKLRISRPRVLATESEITLSSEDLEPTIFVHMGDSITINTGDKSSNLFIDNNYKGRTPMKLYLTTGQHSIRAERGWQVGEQEINLSKDNTFSSLNIETRPQSMTSFMSNGAFFMTGNLGFFKGEQPVWGLNIGDIGIGGQAGWYISLITNGTYLSQVHDRNYAVINAYTYADSHGNVNGGQQPTYTNEESHIRFSALIGLALRVSGPVYLRVGGGYGLRRTAWKAENGSWVVIDPVSWKDFEGSLGLQCHFYNIVVNADALIPVRKTLTTDDKVVEFRVGLGFCLKHKR